MWMQSAWHATIDLPSQPCNGCPHPELCMPLLRRPLMLLLLALALPCSAAAIPARAQGAQAPALVVSDAQLTPEHWIQGRRRVSNLHSSLTSMHACCAMTHRCTTLPSYRKPMHARIEAVSATRTQPLYEAHGQLLDGAHLTALRHTLALHGARAVANAVQDGRAYGDAPSIDSVMLYRAMRTTRGYVPAWPLPVLTEQTQ